MSRGAGHVMQALSEVLAREGMGDSITQAGKVFDTWEVTPAQAVSVRRALRVLEARGEVEDMGRGFRYGRRMWATPEAAQAYRARVRATFGRGAV